MFNLTGDILLKIAPSIKDANNIALWHTEICPLYGINSADILHEFLANELHESNCFTKLSESMDYQTVALTRLFSSKRISADDAYKYGRRRLKKGSIQKANQVVIANIIYGGEWGKENLGNLWGGDGYKFRGSGPIQITGRANVSKFTDYYNKMFKTKYLPEQMVELLRTDLRMGIHSACWIFAISKKLIDEAAADQMKEIIKKINGGYIGITERMAILKLCVQFIKDA